MEEELGGVRARLAGALEGKGAAEERLEGEVRGGERLRGEVGLLKERGRELEKEVGSLRGERDGREREVEGRERRVNEEHEKAVGKERRGRERAVERNVALERELASKAQQAAREGAARLDLSAKLSRAAEGASAARDALAAERKRAEELKEEANGRNKLLGDARDGEQLARAGALAARVELDGIKARGRGREGELVEERDRERKERIKLAAEKAQLFLDHDEIREVLGGKSRELDRALEENGEAMFELRKVREERNEGRRVIELGRVEGLKVNERSRRIGFDEGFDEGMERKGEDVRELVKKMREEMGECLGEIKEIQEGKELAEEQLRIQHGEFEVELVSLQNRLNETQETIMMLKRANSESERLLMEKEHELGRVEEELKTTEVRENENIIYEERSTRRVVSCRVVSCRVCTHIISYHGAAIEDVRNDQGSRGREPGRGSRAQLEEKDAVPREGSGDGGTEQEGAEKEPVQAQEGEQE